MEKTGYFFTICTSQFISMTLNNTNRINLMTILQCQMSNKKL